MTQADPTTDIVEQFTRRGLTIACAESLTAGLVSAGIADVPGASQVLRGGAVTYATDAKASVLGVDAGLLAERGAVDADVAVAMAHGVRALFGADVGVATTGVAGPSMQDGRPVGRCYVAVAVPPEVDAPGADRESTAPDGRCHVEEFTFSGDRAQIRRSAATAAWRLALAHAPDASVGAV